MTKRYQRIVVTLYISVLVAILLNIFVSQMNIQGFAGAAPPRPGVPRFPLWVPIGGNIAITAFLIFLERQLTARSLSQLTRNEAMVHLSLRFVLVIGTIVLGRAPFAVYMVYPVLLFTFFTFGRRTAYGVGLMSTLFVTLFVIGLSPGPLMSTADTNNLTVYLLGLLMVMLLANVLLDERETNQRLQEANSNLEESHTELQAYSAQVATLAATDERNRLARDIHDSLGHHLIASSIQLGKASLFLDRDRDKTATAIDHAQRTIKEALTEVRTSVRALREQESKLDLIPALNDLVSQMRLNDLSIEFNHSGDSTPYATFVKMSLYRIIQEGLTNIHKHAGADQATIDLIFTEQHAMLTISDNGRGFDPEKVLETRRSGSGQYGLRGIQERVALVGGCYEIRSELGKGTTLSITAPKKNEMVE